MPSFLFTQQIVTYESYDRRQLNSYGTCGYRLRQLVPPVDGKENCDRRYPVVVQMCEQDRTLSVKTMLCQLKQKKCSVT